MEQAPTPEGLPPSLRFLKWLVIVLTLTMIIGLITVVAVIVTRIPQSFVTRPDVSAAIGVSNPSGLPDLPVGITLPEGTTPQAITFGAGWTAVVTNDNRILVYATDGQLRQEVPLLAN